jgi:hypothetical protein
MSRKKFCLDRRRDFVLEIQPTEVFTSLEKLGLLSILVSFSADGDAVVESREQQASWLLPRQPWFYPRLVAYGYFWLSERA